MKMFDIGTMEGISRFIRLWFCIFLCDQQLHCGHGLEYDSLSTSVCVFASMGEFLMVDRVYRSCDCPPGRVASLVRLGHLSYERFSVVWDSRGIPLVLHV